MHLQTKMLVMFECSPENLGLIFGAIGNRMANVENLRVETTQIKVRERIEKTGPVQSPHPTPTGGVHGVNEQGERIRLHKNSRIEQLIIERLSQTPGNMVSYAVLTQALVDEGFAVKSLSPAISNLTRLGKIGRSSILKSAWIDHPNQG